MSPSGPAPPSTAVPNFKRIPGLSALKYIYVVNGTGLSHIVTINLDSWSQISPEDQAKIEEIAARLQPEFWAMSAKNHLWTTRAELSVVRR